MIACSVAFIMSCPPILPCRVPCVGVCACLPSCACASPDRFCCVPARRCRVDVCPLPFARCCRRVGWSGLCSVGLCKSVFGWCGVCDKGCQPALVASEFTYGLRVCAVCCACLSRAIQPGPRVGCVCLHHVLMCACKSACKHHVRMSAPTLPQQPVGPGLTS